MHLHQRRCGGGQRQTEGEADHQVQTERKTEDERQREAGTDEQGMRVGEHRVSVSYIVTRCNCSSSGARPARRSDSDACLGTPSVGVDATGIGARTRDQNTLMGISTLQVRDADRHAEARGRRRRRACRTACTLAGVYPRPPRPRRLRGLRTEPEVRARAPPVWVPHRVMFETFRQPGGCARDLVSRAGLSPTGAGRAPKLVGEISCRRPAACRRCQGGRHGLGRPRAGSDEPPLCAQRRTRLSERAANSAHGCRAVHPRSAAVVTSDCCRTDHGNWLAFFDQRDSVTHRQQRDTDPRIGGQSGIEDAHGLCSGVVRIRVHDATIGQRVIG